MRDVTNATFEDALTNPNYGRILADVRDKFKGIIPDDELTYRGHMALFRCLQHHEATKGSKFTTMLYQQAMWQCKKAVRTIRRERRLEPLPTGLPCLRFAYEERAMVRDCIRHLPDEQGRILHEYYFQGLTLREIADVNGYTAATAYNHLRKAEEAFRRMYSPA
jgi:DNA-directed RNA polymerase specialized sigma24 family protein